MLPSKTVSLAIPRNWVDLYETIWKPDCFPKWAAGLSTSPLVQDGNYWKSTEPDETIKIRFTDHNPYGVMDHYIVSGSGREIYMPMRVIPNEHGAEVLITVFRQPLMSDEKFAHDVESVARDLDALYALLTT
ncbi:polyketide cyclase [Erwinia psidii]|uniref:Polyketide cyclase n=1 Tax=Erwinia psidii TaxID=69224 RepID=A0A3N6TUS5_9GAMM|nr:polyketide cyclase [Erwinia psidii]MCX8958658.1 polyketide cyclase [Erwinia psidii]MCX8961213.1 polyketide cyclase [Erwinia psidii]MCX8966815.1 polyketide cyclase [Erwinia psidii]RQM39002.1 polyketide cyclase [Erwinia psidii]